MKYARELRRNRCIAGVLALILALLALPAVSLPVLAEEECAPEEYDALIIKNGLKLWLDTAGAYAPDLAAGVWTSRTGEGEAILDGAWHRTEDGGIAYSVSSVEEWRAQRSKNGLRIEGDNRPLGDFTVEYNVVFHGIVDLGGNEIWHEQSMGQYGLYNGSLSSWAFGALHFMQFLPSRAAGGNSMRVRAMYSANTSYDKTGYVNTMGDHPMTRGLSFRDFFAMTYSHSAATGEDYDRAVYRWYRNGLIFYTFDNRAATVDAAKCYIPNEEGKFRLFYDFPLTVYSVRVYDRCLLEWERNQNYFSDACRANGVSVRGVAELSTDRRIALCSLVTEWQPEWTEAQKQTVRDMIALYSGSDVSAAARALEFDGVQMRLDAPGLRATFSVNESMLSRVETMYSVELGAILAEADSEVTATLVDGKVKAEGGILVSAYRTGEEESRLKSDENGSYFHVAASVGGESGAHYTHEFSFYYYVAVTDGDGLEACFLQKAEGRRLGDTVSFAEGASLLVNEYEGSPYYGYSYNENPVLGGILAAAEMEIEPYRPGQILDDMRDIYVDPKAAGGDGSKEAPFATLKEAFALAKAYFGEEDNVAVTVYLADGVYRTLGVGLDKGDMKEGDWFTVVGSENAVISGGVPVDLAFESVEGESYFVATLPKENGEYPLFRYLTVNGTLADLAYRGYRRYATAAEEGGAMWKTGKVVNDVNAGDYRVYCDPAAFAGMTAAEIRGTELHVEVEWEYKIMHVDYVDFDDVDSAGRVAVYIEEADFKTCVKTNLGYQNRYFWVENRLAFLDAPGEYYYDRAAGKLYYMPKEGENPEDAAFEIGGTENLLYFNNTENVTLVGFTAENCDNLLVETEGYYGGSQAGSKTGGVHSTAAIFGNHAGNFTVMGITVRNAASDGLQLRGALDGIVIADSTFLHIGASAIRVGANNGTWGDGNHLVDGLIVGNLIDDAAWYLRQNCALYVSIAKDTGILHNTVRNCSYTAISAGWSWSSALWMPHENYNLYNVEIAYNYMENYMTDMSDGGGIYTLGGNLKNSLPQYVNTMHHNVAVENANTGAGNGRFMSLYHDGSSSHWYSSKNVVVTAIHLGNSGLGSFYLQIDPAPDHQVLVEHNYFLNADWTKPVKIAGREITGVNSPETYMEKVIFWSHTRPQNNSIQRDNVCYAPDETPSDECLAILDGAGCGRN